MHSFLSKRLLQIALVFTLVHQTRQNVPNNRSLYNDLFASSSSPTATVIKASPTVSASQKVSENHPSKTESVYEHLATSSVSHWGDGSDGNWKPPQKTHTRTATTQSALQTDRPPTSSVEFVSHSDMAPNKPSPTSSVYQSAVVPTDRESKGSESNPDVKPTSSSTPQSVSRSRDGSGVSGDTTSKHSRSRTSSFPDPTRSTSQTEGVATHSKKPAAQTSGVSDSTQLASKTKDVPDSSKSASKTEDVPDSTKSASKTEDVHDSTISASKTKGVQPRSTTITSLTGAAAKSTKSAMHTRSVAVSASPSMSSSLSTVQMSLKWTNWSVAEDDCQNFCSEKGGTVTASRQCISHTVTLNDSVCTKHNTITKVVKCEEPYCPISGTEAFRSSIFIVAVGISLILLTKFVGG